VIVLRWLMLAVATLVTLAALGAADADLQASALRLMASCVVAMLAPLFWPGVGSTRKGTLLRVVGWSLAAAGLAALALGIYGTPRQSLLGVFQACAMLWLVLVVTHGAAAFLDHRWFDASRIALASREMAGRVVALVLALIGSLPLWFGPAAETLASRHDGAVDAALAISPIVHLAIASGNDLMRNEWFYQHSNVASLQFEYPGLPAIAMSYSTALLAMGLLVVAFPRRRPPARGTPGVA
jgi:hypothetical protein